MAYIIQRMANIKFNVHDLKFGYEEWYDTSLLKKILQNEQDFQSMELHTFNKSVGYAQTCLIPTECI